MLGKGKTRFLFHPISLLKCSKASHAVPQGHSPPLERCRQHYSGEEGHKTERQRGDKEGLRGG